MTLTPVEPRIRDRGRSPELVGGVATVLVVSIVGLVLVIGGRPAEPPGPGASETPVSSVEPTTTPTPPVDVAVADLLIILSKQLQGSGERLAVELERDDLATADVSSIIREINASARYGVDAVASLGTSPEAIDLATRMGASFTAMREISTRTLRASVTNERAYREGAALLLEELAALPDFQEELRALQVVPSARPSPSPEPTTSANSPEASAPPTPTDAETQAPTPTATSTSTATAVPGLPNQVVNGGFERVTVEPWLLDVAPGASASLSTDATAPAAGSRAARVDVSTPTPAFTGILLRQSGIRVAAGARYVVSVALRSDAPRDVRIQVTSQEGETYVTRLGGAGLGWAAFTFEFIAPATDPDARVEIGLGRYPGTVWIDEVSVSAPVTTPP